MRFLNILWHCIIALVCVAPIGFIAKSLRCRPRYTTSRDVRIIECLSLGLPRVFWNLNYPKSYIGIISSAFPGKCMISESVAKLIAHSNYDLPTDDVPIVFSERVSLPGFERTLFYPFREFADELGYDVLWCTFKEPGARNYTGHVLFANRFPGGVWIRVSEEYLKQHLGDIYRGSFYTGGWLYASTFGNPKAPLSYFVQRYTSVLSVSSRDVLEVVKP